MDVTADAIPNLRERNQPMSPKDTVRETMPNKNMKDSILCLFRSLAGKSVMFNTGLVEIKDQPSEQIKKSNAETKLR